MKAKDLLKDIAHLEGLIGVWSHLREKLDSDLRSTVGDGPLVTLRDVDDSHVSEVAEEMDTFLTELQEALDETLEKDMT